LIHGQGLTAPHELDARWQKILFPVRIADRVQTERAMAEQNGLRHRIDSLTVGCIHTIVAGQMVKVEPTSWLMLLDQESERTVDLNVPFFPTLAYAPLRAEVRDRSAQQARILDLLNTRFLPYLFGLRQPPVLHLLASAGGAYRIRVHYGHTIDDEVWDYVLSYNDRNCVAYPVEEDTFAQEVYWANDLEDFLDGRCDEFTPFCRAQLPAQEMRLWVSLATPMLNSDLVRKRVRLHFERARLGLEPGSWVMALFVARP